MRIYGWTLDNFRSNTIYLTRQKIPVDMNKSNKENHNKNSKTTAYAYPAATVILLRDAPDNFEVLLVRRNSKLSFHGGAWVFPGGRIDADDYQDDAQNDINSAACNAAVREIMEECSLSIVREDLEHMATWTTPVIMPKRFKTWFFVTASRKGRVQVDGSEIREHCWMRPDQALDAKKNDKIDLPPPTFVSLKLLSEYNNINSVLSNLENKSPLIFNPVKINVPGGFCTLYDDDAGYENADIDHPGRRHRLWVLETGWRYERPN